MNTTPVSIMSGTHLYSQEEVYGFSQYININLKKCRTLRQFLPIDPNSENLFKVVGESSGLLLYELILMGAGERKPVAQRELAKFKMPQVNKPLNTFDQNFNVDFCLKAAQVIGVKVINVGIQDIRQGKPHLVLGILWQIIKIGLKNKLQLTSDKAFENEKEFENLMVQWVQEQTGQKVNNLASDFANGDLLLQLVTKLAKNQLIDLDFQLEEELLKSPEEKIEKALLITDSLGIERFLRTQDIQSGNNKLVFTLLTEIFSNSIQKELGVGKDMASDMKVKSFGKQLNDEREMTFIKNFNFTGHMHYDQFKARGLLDPIEVVINLNEYNKKIIQREQLQFSPQLLEENTYQILLSNISQQELDGHINKCLMNVRDIIDEIQSKNLQNSKIYTDLFVIFKCLMLLASDEYQRIEIRKTDFSYLLEKLKKMQLPTQTILPMLFYLHEMSLVTGTQQFDEIARSFVNDFEKQLSQLSNTYYDQKAAFVYICWQIQAANVDLIVNQAIELTKQVLTLNPVQQQIMVTTSVSMLYVLLGQQKQIQFKTFADILERAYRFLNNMHDEFYKSLKQQLTSEFVQDILKIYPLETSQFLLDTQNAEKSLNQVLNFTSIEEFDEQRSILADSIIVKALKDASIQEQVKNNPKILQQIEKLLKIDKPQEELLKATYHNLIDDNLGNEYLRCAARNTVFGCSEYNQAVARAYLDTFEQVAKSSSITAFLESLRDLINCKAVLIKNEEMMVKAFDVSLACLSKYENNPLVVCKVLEFFKAFADQPAYVSCQAFEQTDAYTEDMLSDRQVCIQYLEVVREILTQTKHDIFQICTNSLHKCLRLHSEDAFIVKLYFDTCAGFAGVRLSKQFTDDSHFWQRVKDNLANFTSNNLVIQSIVSAAEQLIGGCALCCQEAQDAGIFKVLRQYAKFWQKDVQICDDVIKAHIWGFHYINNFQMMSQNGDVLDDLETLIK